MAAETPQTQSIGRVCFCAHCDQFCNMPSNKSRRKKARERGWVLCTTCQSNKDIVMLFDPSFKRNNIVDSPDEKRKATLKCSYCKVSRSIKHFTKEQLFDYSIRGTKISCIHCYSYSHVKYIDADKSGSPKKDTL